MTLAIAASLATPAAFARSVNATSNAGPPAVANTHAMANSNGPSSADRDFGLDRAEDRMSARGRANSNNPSSADRDTGSDRAADRKNAHAKAKSKVAKSKHASASKHQSL
jgi:hypothetical protein